jgi:hypothetical protein
MPFVVSGLPPESFEPLFGLPDEELIKHRARRVVVDGPGYPERIEMRDAEPGEVLLLVNFEHQDADTPFRSCHAVYIREGADCRWTGTTIPPVLAKRLLSLRAFSRDGMLIDADVVDGTAAEPVIDRFFTDAAVAYIHAHYARPGCYAARIDRG